MPAAPETKTPQQRAEALHAWYCAATRQPISWTMGRMMIWEQWLARGHNGSELAKVIKYLQPRIDRGERNAGALKFRNLIGDVDAFEEELGMILAHENKTRRGPLPPLPDAVAAPIAAAVQTARTIVSAEQLPDLEPKRKAAAAQLAALKANL